MHERDAWSIPLCPGCYVVLHKVETSEGKAPARKADNEISDIRYRGSLHPVKHDPFQVSPLLGHEISEKRGQRCTTYAMIKHSAHGVHESPPRPVVSGRSDHTFARRVLGTPLRNKP